MAVNKNFVVKNGIEVATDLIFASSDLNKVGIGSTQPSVTLDVSGGIGATSLQVTGDTLLVGVVTFSNNIDANGNLDVDGHTELDNLNVSGIATFGGTLDFNGDLDVDGHLEVDNINVSGVSTFTGDIDANGGLDVDGHTELDNLKVSGVSTFTGAIDANGALDVDGHTELDDVNVSGASTFTGAADFNGAVDIDGHTELDDVNVSGASTFTGAADFNGNIDVDGHTELDDLRVSGVSTLSGNTFVGSAVSIYASTGIVSATKFYGDGSNLSGVTATAGGSLGFSTAGAVGYGVTLLNFIGAGVSDITTPHSGIATLTIVGGGGGGSASIGIGTTVGDAFSGIVTAGNLWYNTNEGRLFIYYFDGSSSQWVDAAPFNIGIIASGLQSLDQGTALSPPLAFSGDSTTGLFSPATSKQTFVSAGASILNINSTGIEVTGVSSVGSAITMYGSSGIVSATQYYGDGSKLTGITAGATLSAGSGSQRIVLTSLNSGTMTSAATDAELTYHSGTDTLTATNFSGSLSGNATGLSGTPNITVGNIVAAAATFTGVLTYEDVTNVDSLGIVTAREGIRVGTVSVGGTVGPAGSGIVTYYGDGSQLTGISAGGISTTASSPAANTTVTLNLGTAQHHDLTLSAGITTITCTGGNFGESHSVVITQPSSGIATIGFSTYFLFPSGSIPSMSEGGSQVDLISFVVRKEGAAGIGTQLLASAGLNYQ